MKRILILAPLLTALAIVIQGCGGSDSNGESATSGGTDSGPTAVTPDRGELRPILINSELVVGSNRFSVGLVDADNATILEEPGTTVDLRFFYPADESGQLRQEANARFVWAIEDSTGIWVANVDFDEAGDWKAEAFLRRNGEERTVAFTFAVLTEGLAPNVGDQAPPTVNRTLSDVPDIARISTDPEPDPTLYEMTVADALREGKPLVVVFATPAFCQTRFCGPVVDIVKEVKTDYAGQVNFIHIEPYELDPQGQLVSSPDSGPKLSAEMIEWNFRSEPWVMVVDGEGLVSSRFEGTATTDELRQAIEATLG